MILGAIIFFFIGLIVGISWRSNTLQHQKEILRKAKQALHDIIVNHPELGAEISEPISRAQETWELINNELMEGKE